MQQNIDINTPLYFAGLDTITNYRCDIIDPANAPVRLNIYIVFDSIVDPDYGQVFTGKEVKRTKSIELVQGTTYRATFDINNVLMSEIEQLPVSTAFSFPADPDEPVKKFNVSMLNFYIDTSYTYLDTDGNYQEEGRTDNSAQERWNVLKGGASFYMEHYLSREEVFFNEWFFQFNKQVRFLSWIPDNMPVHPEQPVRLWLYNNTYFTGAGELILKTEITYTDGSIREETIKTIDGEKGLYEIAVGPVELRLITYDVTKTIDSYKVWVTSREDQNWTERKYFKIDYSAYERSDLMFAVTSLGVSEVFWSHGRRSEQIKTAGSERMQPVLNFGAGILNTLTSGKGTIRNYKPTRTRTYKMNSGFWPKHMRDYLIDLLTAGEAKLPVNFFYLPVSIQPGSFDFGNDDDDLFSVSYNAKVAYVDNFYSKVPEVDSPWGDFNNDFNEDFF